MNKKLNLVKILKDCPKGWKLYSPIFGEVDFKEIRDEKYPIITKSGLYNPTFTEEGFYYDDAGKECLLFPSKDQRDWSKFTAPWYKAEKFDIMTLKPFDKVIVKNNLNEWTCVIFSHISDYNYGFPCNCCDRVYRHCIPYNDDTKHLVGTTDEAPEYYRYWEA